MGYDTIFCTERQRRQPGRRQKEIILIRQVFQTCDKEIFYRRQTLVKLVFEEKNTEALIQADLRAVKLY